MPPSARFIVGIDASGPANSKDTCACVLAVAGGRATYLRHVSDLGDAAAIALVGGLAQEGSVVVGIDAPLSYQDGGGDRERRDSELRQDVQKKGLLSGSVMTPTMTRMAYLTLRGMGLARGIQLACGPDVRIVEVHPGAALVLREAPASDVRTVKSDEAARKRLAAWLREEGLDALPDEVAKSDHALMSAAAALAAWGWSEGRTKWIRPAEPPLHPFDFVA
jgi:predicted nuclease with RNAse H fold